MPISVFRYCDYRYDRDSRLFRLRYEIEHAGTTRTCVEELVLPPHDSSLLTDELVERFGQQLHLMLGISYWKMYCPETIEHPYALTHEEADFWQMLFTEGLGEFYYQNQIDFRSFRLFSATTDHTEASAAITVPVEERPIVGIGGGKDSLVSLELLKEEGFRPLGFLVEHEHQKKLDTILSLIDIETLRFQRRIDPQLTTVPDQYRGHVPVSAIYGLVGVIAAVLGRADAVLVSNEASANYGNTTYLGMEINHQWSKSLRFEEAFRAFISATVTPSITYASLLRPLSEYRIGQIFAQYTQYHHAFSSCNRNFRQAGDQTDSLGWCGECPKCVFSFALLSAFLPKEEVLTIFGQNLYENSDLLPLAQELLGVAAIKPFDCVGTPDEMIVSMARAAESGDYDEDFLMQYFRSTILPDHPDWRSLEASLLRIGPVRTVPDPYQSLISKLA